MMSRSSEATWRGEESVPHHPSTGAAPNPPFVLASVRGSA